MPKNNQKNFRATELMNAAMKLRASGASLDDAVRESWQLYPASNGTDGPLRSRLLRLFEADPKSFAAAAAAFRTGANQIEIVALASRRDPRGAPTGNKNAHGKRKQSTVARLEKLWQEASPSDKKLFLQRNVSK